MLSSHLTYLIEAQEPADLRRLAEHLPYEWIERAVQANGHSEHPAAAPAG